MSETETETRTGTLEIIKMHDGETIEQASERILSGLKIEKPRYYDTFEEFLEEGTDYKYLAIDGIIYKIVDEKDYEYADIFESRDNQDGTIDFLIKYYNGGCGFGEAIEKALKNKK